MDAQYVGVVPPRELTFSNLNDKYKHTDEHRQIGQTEDEISLSQVDAQYVGVVPPRELTFSNLNDNIDDEFLNKMCAKFGQLDQVKIYAHPETRKSLGLAKVRLTLL